MKKLIKIGLLIYLCSISFYIVGQNSVGWPSITNEMKPWTRWWWMGSSVDEINLTKALKSYYRVGLGGMEITPIYGVKGMEPQFISYTSAKWMKLLEYSLSESKKLGLGMDLALASGWPFGGPWVKPDDACKSLEFKIYSIKPGEAFSEKIELVQKPMVRAVSKNVPIEQLTDPIASNDSLYIYAFDQVRFPRKLPLVALMAYSNAGDIVDLTDKVGKDGSLSWSEPDKDWTLVAAFMSWHGKQVERAGPGSEGDVIDHFSEIAIKNYLNHFDESAKGFDISGVRAFFNDSYEVDDAVGESFYTPGFFMEFEKRRGYDLKKHLPALLGKTMDEEQLRLLCDFRETISDLLLDNFTKQWQKWAKSKGKIIRNQSHGSPANILDLYAASDIPETEGIDLLNIKFASSAAHVTGKKLVSAETATWLNEHFLGTLAQCKQNIDLYFLGGINHIVYHGTPYSPEDAAWPGWMFYASVHFAPTNPIWNDFPALNSYVARVQSFLQQATVDNDILLYFPIHDQWMEKGKSWLHHFHGASPTSEVYKLASELQKKGFSFDFASDRQISKSSFVDASIVTDGNKKYKVILVPKVKYIPLETFNKLLYLANDGAKIIFINQMPNDIPGFDNLLSKKMALENAKKTLNLVSDSEAIKEYSKGNGSFVIGDDFDKLLGKLNVLRESMVDEGLGYLRLSNDLTKVYFITNSSGKSLDKWINLQTSSPDIILYNPMTGEFGKAKCKVSQKGDQQIRVQLKIGESCIVQIWNKSIKVKDFQYWKRAGEPIVLGSKWNVKFVKGGPELPKTLSDIDLISWDQINETTKIFSGTAVYTCKFSIPDTKCDAWEISLGEVYESASLTLNGKEIGTLIGPDYRLVIDKKNIKKENNIEISVSNLMANRIIYMDKNNIPYKKFYNTNFNAKLKENSGTDGKFTSTNWEYKKSGLIGPVTLTPLKND